MLEQERDKAMAEEQAEAARRSQQEAQALRAQHEQQKREYEARAAALAQQQHAARVASLQANRTQNWGTNIIGEYDSIEPVQPQKRFFGFGGSK
jgi:hypothetical protein